MSDIVKKYIGAKIVVAAPMTREDFEKKAGYKVGWCHNDNGYEVVDGNWQSSWIPEDVFVEAYRPTDGGMTFGLAIEAMKKGKKVARLGWNGKRMWLDFVKSENYIVYETPHGGLLPWIGMKTADGKFVPWLASQTDMLAEDWYIVE